MDEPIEEKAPYQRADNLLKKYDIPVSHLDFSYVENCTNGREIEKILHVLQSGQEGHFPDLMRKTEERLAQIKPNSKYIRKPTPVIEKQLLNEHDLRDLSEDLNTWLKDVSKTSHELDNARRRSCSSNQPDIRRSQTSSTSEEKKENDLKRIKSTDYSSWDKYDPDTEILKMDLQSERMRKEIEQKDKEVTKKECAVKFNQFSTQAEAIFEADREREKGNEFFKAEEYIQAITYYTNSINCMPSAKNFNNRAIARIKLKDYNEAKKDCLSALKYEPNNIKAQLRLVKCYESLGEFKNGLNEAEKIIQINPNNTTAQNYINKLNNQLKIKAKVKTRMMIVEIEDNSNCFQKVKPQLNYYKKNTNHSRNIVDINNETNNNITHSSRKGVIIEEIEDETAGIICSQSDTKKSKITFDVADKSCSEQSEPDLSKRPSKSILKKKHILLPIPGPSTMPEPYFVMVENKDPEIIKRQEYILSNRPQLICLNNIDTTMDENECLEVHIRSSREKEVKEERNKDKKAGLIKCRQTNGIINVGENTPEGVLKRKLEEQLIDRNQYIGKRKNDYSKKKTKNFENESKSRSILTIESVKEKRNTCDDKLTVSTAETCLIDSIYLPKENFKCNNNNDAANKEVCQDIITDTQEKYSESNVETVNGSCLNNQVKRVVDIERKGKSEEFLKINLNENVKENIIQEREEVCSTEGNNKQTNSTCNQTNVDENNLLEENVEVIISENIYKLKEMKNNIMYDNVNEVEEMINKSREARNDIDRMRNNSNKSIYCHKEDIDSKCINVSLSANNIYHQTEITNNKLVVKENVEETNFMSRNNNLERFKIDVSQKDDLTNLKTELFENPQAGISENKLIRQCDQETQHLTTSESKLEALDNSNFNVNPNSRKTKNEADNCTSGKSKLTVIEPNVTTQINKEYDANNNQGDNYFINRKWNNRRRNIGNRNNSDALYENERNVNSIDENVSIHNRRQNVQDMQEPHICIRETINVEELRTPYSFLKMWNSIGHDMTYTKHAEVLRHLDYNRLSEVIGYKLDGTMLSTIVSTLYSHFMVPHEIERVSNLLRNISGMERFRIVSMFLSRTDKCHVKSLFQFLQQHANPLPEDIMGLYF